MADFSRGFEDQGEISKLPALNSGPLTKPFETG
jgi:hypothetical protein